MDINSHAKALGQKYMGVRPQGHRDEMFRDTSLKENVSHPVPVSNFLNAQCRPSSMPQMCAVAFVLTQTVRLLRDQYRHSPSNVQGRA